MAIGYNLFSSQASILALDSVQSKVDSCTELFGSHGGCRVRVLAGCSFHFVCFIDVHYNRIIGYSYILLLNEILPGPNVSYQI